MTNSELPLGVLRHHGVKGMKWGVRRELKREGKARVQALGASLHFGPGRDYGSREISEHEYKNLPNKPIKLGTSFKRIGDSTGNLRDFVYVTKTHDDHVQYKALLSPNGKLKGKKFELSLHTAKEAVSPSLKERVDTYVKLLGQDIPHGNTVVKGRDYVLGKNPNAAAKALSDREIGFRTYQQFAQSQHMGQPIHTAYFNSLRKKGYNSVVDDADRGVMSDLPIILFPKESGTRVTEIKPVSKDDILRAKSKLRVVAPSRTGI